MSKQDFARGKSHMVSKLLALGYTYFSVPNQPIINGEKRWKHCMALLNAWFLTSAHSPVKKEVTAMTYRELAQAVTVFQRIYSDFLKRI